MTRTLRPLRVMNRLRRRRPERKQKQRRNSRPSQKPKAKQRRRRNRTTVMPLMPPMVPTMTPLGLCRKMSPPATFRNFLRRPILLFNLNWKTIPSALAPLKPRYKKHKKALPHLVRKLILMLPLPLPNFPPSRMILLLQPPVISEFPPLSPLKPLHHLHQKQNTSAQKHPPHLLSQPVLIDEAELDLWHSNNTPQRRKYPEKHQVVRHPLLLKRNDAPRCTRAKSNTAKKRREDGARGDGVLNMKSACHIACKVQWWAGTWKRGLRVTCGEGFVFFIKGRDVMHGNFGPIIQLLVSKHLEQGYVCGCHTLEWEEMFKMPGRGYRMVHRETTF